MLTKRSISFLDQGDKLRNCSIARIRIIKRWAVPQIANGIYQSILLGAIEKIECLILLTNHLSPIRFFPIKI